MARLEEHMRDQDRKLDLIDTHLSNLDDKFDNLLVRLDKRYASKLVERVVYTMIGLILAAFLGLLISAAFHKTPTTVTQNVTTPSDTETVTTPKTTSPAAATKPSSSVPSGSSSSPSQPATSQPSTQPSVIDNIRSFLGL